MKLFSKIYVYLLLGIVSMLIIDGNLNYEAEIEQFDIDMANNAQQIGRLMSGMVSHAWLESGEKKAIHLIEDANRADQNITLRWVWLDEITLDHGTALSKVFDGSSVQHLQPTTFIGLDEKHYYQRFTYVPVHIPGDRAGALQLIQSLEPLNDYTQKMLIRSLTITTLLALISGVIIYIFIYTKIKRPLEKLSLKAIEIGKGNLEANLEIKGDDELVSLAKIMNDMCTRLLIAKEKIHFENLARLKTLEQLRHTEKLSTVGQIAAGVAHEIGTPLNVVDGRAKMILSGTLQPEEVTSSAKIIKAQAERMTLIIRQLLDYSRKRKSSLRARENVTTLLKQVFHLLTPIATKLGVSLDLHVAPETKVYSQVDSQQLQQIFMNIIMNGIQATPQQGTVRVDVSNTLLKSMTHTDDQLQEFIRIDTSDEGPGIPEENLQEIFTPFFTTKKIGLGTGLGLSIAQELLEEHGGWVEVENLRVRGARFSLFLELEEDTE